MPRLEIRPFADDHLDEAARRLAERHARHREAEPLLPDVTDVRAEVESAWRAEGASGAAVLRDGELVGYLIGAPRDVDRWGANVWVEAAGHAAVDAELVRDLYEVAATRWVDEGRARHYALVPATDAALVDAWFRLSFGAQHAHGIREVPDTTAYPDGVRDASEDDVAAMVELSPLLGRHQALAPVFGAPSREPTEEAIRQDIAEDLAAHDVGNLVAEIDGRVVGNFVVVPATMTSMHTGLARPENAAFLGFAITAPEARGSGAGVALTEACFAWARERGYDTMITDWRVTNLLSSRFWPRRGFRETFLRLYRSIP
ncbi:MAG: GNAT family N-acetyltransferase [Actinomycetota bacterium]|nr:GNAT family N-acetyltransferase [Actinomycetota bacterium]